MNPTAPDDDGDIYYDADDSALAPQPQQPQSSGSSFGKILGATALSAAPLAAAGIASKLFADKKKKNNIKKKLKNAKNKVVRTGKEVKNKVVGKAKGVFNTVKKEAKGAFKSKAD